MPARGFVMVTRAVVHSHGLSGQAKLIYVLLRSRLDRDGWCYPGMATLVAESGWSRPTVTRALSELVAAGLIERHRRGKTQVNAYRVMESPLTSPAASEGNGLYITDPSDGNELDINGGDVNELAITTASDVKPVAITRDYCQAGLSEVPQNGASDVKPAASDVKPVDTNDTYLTRSTGTSTGDTSSGTSGAATSSRGRAREAAAVPAGLTAFDTLLHDFPEYRPTAPFYAKVLDYQAQGIDIDVEAIKIGDWRIAKEKHKASIGTVLNWLKREADRGTPGQDSGRAYRHGGAGQRAPSRPAGAYDEFARYSIRSDDPRLTRRPAGPLAPGDSGAR